ncbi:hypothetical protein [Streptomyces stelliscabiei]|uniref:hypothetical protein n=1 Tax=Streptomyces stelliscabiei TaxID=146820 RepID=UPI0029BF86E6|nr:hypothetical protein [Streptomyces stelliscabiei]MDX2550480.1 hypothetical protein [Streptomyces stelliscabiei]MDX2610178.1 hypothetical protein [Streptomyces stelliscabiei]MDX2634901.1 hypothetical protein [Streptomyces stelliscabiei]MDX2659847.1 hypothetical protein [Streptomyces stelliscabiei]MDX2711460.1 hypothetical protein [Streptomyces stelliscabiei]
MKHADVLSGLAANASLPPELVDRLIELAVADTDADFTDDLAKRPDLTHAQALALYARVPESGPQLACEGRLTVADVDPAADPDTALALLGEGRGDPVWGRVLVADPDFLRRQRLARCVGLPPDVVETLAAGPDVRVVGELALWTTDRALATRLAGHPNAEVRKYAAWNEATPPAVLAALLDDKGLPPVQRCSVCGVEETGCEVWAYDVCGGTHETAVHDVRHGALSNPATPIEAAIPFADDPSELLRRALAERSDLPPEVSRRLATDPDVHIRACIAEKPAGDDALMRVLAEDEYQDVRRRLAHNPNVPLDVLVRLIATTKIGPTLLPRVEAASPAEVGKLAHSADSTVRMLVALRRDLPAEIRDALATDPDAKVLKSIAPHPGLSEARLRAMVDRHGVQVLAAVAANPDASGALLEHLAHDCPPVHQAFREIAAHPHATPRALLACLTDGQARPIAAGHPALPPQVIVELLADDDGHVAKAAAGNASLPGAVMRNLVP